MRNNLTLGRHIKWAIGSRIMLCLASLSLVVLISSSYDMAIGYRQVNTTLNGESKALAEHIIAQSLISNEAGITTKIKELNKNINHAKFEWRPDLKVGNEPKMKWVFPFSWVYSYPVSDNDEKIYGNILVGGSFFYDNSILFQLVVKFSLLLFFSVFVFILLYPLSNRIPHDLFITPIMNLLTLLRHRSNVSDKNKKAIFPLEFLEIQEKIIELMNEITENARKIALGQMASQVAHDIRSPLCALDVVVKDAAAIPEDQRILIRTAINRIHDIANNLLSLHEVKTTLQADTDHINFPEFIADLILSVVSEKRVRVEHRKITFNIDIKESAYCAFASVSTSGLKRVLSNLFDNAIESMNDKENGVINITLSSEKNTLTITVQDNGCGIAAHALTDIRERKMCTSKTNGHGLGLSYTIKMIEKIFGGKFHIQSCIDAGTKIDLVLPRILAPKWFVEKLLILPTSTIVILDDDEAIHQVWRNRFKNIDSPTPIFDFYSADEFIAWHQNHSSQSLLFLVDFELIGDDKSGLDVIEKLGISSQAYLVTSRYDELHLRQRCEKLGLRIIPKSFAAHISIVT